MIYLDYRDARPIYTQIVENFRQQIRAGILCQGDRLPSVRELAAQLAINPNTIQRAYRELELLGLVATVQGKGCFVCAASGAAIEASSAWKALDEALQNLFSIGMDREEVIQYIRKGGNRNA